MERVLIFDVDGTLAQSGQKIDPSFADFLMSFWLMENCYLVSGSHMEKLRSQLPSKLINSAMGVFASSGSEFYIGDEAQYIHEHSFPAELMDYCKQLIELSPFCWRTGNHVDVRPGLLNVSVVGKNADRLDRKRYVDFDKVAGEREYLASSIMRLFPNYEVTLGGQISIDISPKGWNKGRVFAELEKLHPHAEIIFFGDRLEVGGNDKPLADRLLSAGHQAIAVKNFRETEQILREKFDLPALFRKTG